MAARREYTRAVKEKKEWIPKTELGRKVLSGEITDINAIYDSGKKILEHEIVDHLLPELIEEVMQVSSIQRMTAYGRKQQMRAIVILGNKQGFIGVGVGKAAETRDAIASAIVDAKRRLVRVNLGCGSWECGCGTQHSIVMKANGQSGSTKIIIMPAPRGVGLVAGEVSHKVLEMAGIKDVWTFTKGRTRNILNMVLATISALDSLNKVKRGSGA